MTHAAGTGGPLSGIRVVELAGIGPGPHAAMVLADLGADVVRVERPGPVGGAGERDVTLRGRRWVRADLKNPDDRERVLAMVEKADALVEGFRPGVAERLGIGPDDCLARNPRLVYGRMTGWGQDGPRAPRAGHDLNYLSVTGALAAIGRPGSPPPPPLNLVADYGGGSMLLLVGVLAALVERERSGVGQVVDAAMVDGVSLLAQLVWSMRAIGAWSGPRGGNLLDGGAPFYDCYACADGRYIALAALEPPFYTALLQGLGLGEADLPTQYDPTGWPRLREAFTTTIATRSRDEWATAFQSSDACVTPVLTWDEAAAEGHLVHRGTLIDVGGVVQAAPAPRFSRSGTAPPTPVRVADDTEQVMADWGLSNGLTREEP
jgi:alpha-methylacyl-CoA racemase